MIDPSTLQRWERLSPSSLDEWEKCPRAWHADRVLGKRTQETYPMLVGTFGHSILEHLMAEAPDRRTLEAAKAIASDLWPEFAASQPYMDLELRPERERAFKHAVWRGIGGFFDLQDPKRAHLDPADTLRAPPGGRELPLAAELGGAVVVGIADRVDEGSLGAVVTDYKFGKAPAKPFREKKKRQLRIYAALIQAMTGLLPRRGQLLYVADGVKVSEMFTQEKVDEAVGDIAVAWEEIQQARERNQWKPKPGPLCGWCPLVAECPEGAAEVRRRDAEGRLKPSAPARRLLDLA